MNKNDIRKIIFEKRKFANINLLNLKFHKIFNKYYNKLKMEDEIIGTFFPMKYEVDTINIIKRLSKKNVIALPKIIDIDDKIIFKKWNCDKNMLIKNNKKKGIFEPDIKNETIIPNILLISGVAFDLEKNRLGYGKGYYDKYLFENKNILKIGICFNFQLFNKIPTNPYDVKMDYILTETRLIK